MQQGDWQKTTNSADMNFQQVFGVFYKFFVLVVNTAWSWEVVNFRSMKSDAGEFVCGMSPANETANDVGSKALCMSSCFHVCPSPCQAVNYWKNTKLCQHFYYVPCSYGVQQDCINYQVVVV